MQKERGKIQICGKEKGWRQSFIDAKVHPEDQCVDKRLSVSISIFEFRNGADTRQKPESLGYSRY